MGVSQLLGARARVPPKVYAYVGLDFGILSSQNLIRIQFKTYL